MYFESYDPGTASATYEDALTDVRASFAGDYGELWQNASLVATSSDQQIVAALLLVVRAPWPDTPDCPFIIELFTDRLHRRRGLARTLVRGTQAAIAGADDTRLALRVSGDNEPALALYQQLGFKDWVPA